MQAQLDDVSGEGDVVDEGRPEVGHVAGLEVLAVLVDVRRDQEVQNRVADEL